MQFVCELDKYLTDLENVYFHKRGKKRNGQTKEFQTSKYFMCAVHFLFLASLRKTPCMASNIIRIGHTVCTTCCDGVNIPQYSRAKSKLTES